jgi:predicted RecB family nuclease
MLAFSEELLIALGEDGPVFVYSHFEKTRLNELASMFPQFSCKIEGIVHRLVDLLPLARNHYYHPQMKGSWSIKAVLPTIAPDLDYGNLQEVRDGAAAQSAYLEAIDSQTFEARRAELRPRMLEYCRMDVLALVRLAWFFQDRNRGTGLIK